MNENAAADWYDDPNNPTRYRYWDGHQWTDNYAPKSQTLQPAPRSGKGKTVAIMVAGIAALGLVGAVMGSEETPSNADAPNSASNGSTGEQDSPSPVSYKELTDRQWKLLVKNPDEYSGDHYIVYANVTQFDAATGDDVFRGDAANRNLTSAGFWEGYDNSIFTGSAGQLRRVVQGDVVRMKVTVGGSTSYETQIGGETTVPEFQVDKISVIGSTDF